MGTDTLTEQEAVFADELEVIEADIAELLSDLGAVDAASTEPRSSRLTAIVKKANLLQTRHEVTERRQAAAQALFDRTKHQHKQLLKTYWLEAFKTNRIKPLLEQIDKAINAASNDASSTVQSILSERAARAGVDPATRNAIHAAAKAEATEEFERMVNHANHN